MSVEGCRADQCLGWVKAGGGRCTQGEEERWEEEGVMHCSRGMESEEEEGEVQSRCYGNSGLM